MKKLYIISFFSGLIFIYACTKKTTTTSDKYFPQVKTIIQKNCLSCHSSSGSWGGRPTQFDTDTQIASSYASIKAAVADPETVTNKRMPKGGTLSTNDIDIIVKWFNKGGKTTD